MSRSRPGREYSVRSARSDQRRSPRVQARYARASRWHVPCTTRISQEGDVQVLIADDEPLSRRLLQAALGSAGYEVVTADDGAEAWEILRRPDAPRLAVLDWMMPKVDGVQICRRLRRPEFKRYTYVVLLTARGQKHDIQVGMEAGADDYITKPCDLDEMLSRLRAGERILRLQWLLQEHVEELESALAHVKKLQGLLPICMHCKRIRDDENTWHGIEAYIEQHSEAMFTHALCKGCLEEHYPEYATEEAPNSESSKALADAVPTFGEAEGDAS